MPAWLLAPGSLATCYEKKAPNGWGAVRARQEEVDTLSAIDLKNVLVALESPGAAQS